VIYSKSGKVKYPKAKGPGYYPINDPCVNERPPIFNSKGKVVKQRGLSPYPRGYIPPGANNPPVPKGCQLVQGPKGCTLLVPSKRVARKVDMLDGTPNGTWYGYPIAVGIMLTTPQGCMAYPCC